MANSARRSLRESPSAPERKTSHPALLAGSAADKQAQVRVADYPANRLTRAHLCGHFAHTMAVLLDQRVNR